MAAHRPRPLSTRETLDWIISTLMRIEAKEDLLMALSAEELGIIAQISTDVDAIVAAATSHDSTLQAKIDELNVQIGELSANDAADAAQIESLTQVAADLQAALDAHSADVVTALTGLDDHVKAVTPSS